MFLFSHIDLNIRHCFLFCFGFFVIFLSALPLFGQVFILHFACIVIAAANYHGSKSSQNKLDRWSGQHNHTVVVFFFTHFYFESVLSSSTQLKLPVFGKLGKISVHSFYLISGLIFLCCMINILIKMKKLLVQ